MSELSRQQVRAFRHSRIRKKISGSAERPRMAIHVSNRHMTVQFVNDDQRRTLASASSVKGGEKNNVATATGLGQKAAQAALDNGIRFAVVDRGGFAFHGRVKAIVEAVKEAGISMSAKEAK